MIRCTFAGHRDVVNIQESDIEIILENIILQAEESVECLVGGMGKFDKICASAVRNLKRKYRERKIVLILVLPYMQKRINREKAYFETMFDEIIIPAELEKVHYKKAIEFRNRWMIDQSDYLIAMVYRKTGGAYKTWMYAQKKGIEIINIENG